MNPSILPAELRGVMFASGYRGIGKSFLAAQADLPRNIAFLDYEQKGRGIDVQLDFGLYLPVTQLTAGSGPIAVYDRTVQAISDLPDDTFTVLILDNISPLELGLNAEGKRHDERYARQYGLNLKNIRAGRFGGTRAIANYLISDHICAPAHAKGIRLVIATSHVKPRWGAGGPIPGKLNVKGADRWQELSVLTLILIPGDSPPIPAGLVQKEMLGTISFPKDISDEEIEAMMKGEGGHVVQRRLPFRIPECTFTKIRWYLENPADLSKPAAGEMPTLEESNPFSAKLSREQFELMRLALLKEQREEEETESTLKVSVSSPPTTLVELKQRASLTDVMTKTGLALPEIVKDVQRAWRKYKYGEWPRPD